MGPIIKGLQFFAVKLLFFKMKNVIGLFSSEKVEFHNVFQFTLQFPSRNKSQFWLFEVVQVHKIKDRSSDKFLLPPQRQTLQGSNLNKN